MNCRINMKKRLKRMAKDEGLYLSVYLSNLGKYNEGDLVGKWVEVDGETDWDAEMKEIGISSQPDAEGNIYEEWFISDYDTNIPGIANDLGENPSLDELDEIGKFINDENVDEEIFKAVYEATGDFEGTKRRMRDGDYFFASDVKNDQDLGYYIVENVYGNLSELGKDVLEMYFDYESFGRDVRIEESGDYTKQGYISVR